MWQPLCQGQYIDQIPRVDAEHVHLPRCWTVADVQEILVHPAALIEANWRMKTEDQYDLVSKGRCNMC